MQDYKSLCAAVMIYVTLFNIQTHRQTDNISHLKACLVEEWLKFDQKIIDLVIRQWHTCLHAFENTLSASAVLRLFVHPSYIIKITYCVGSFIFSVKFSVHQIGRVIE